MGNIGHRGRNLISWQLASLDFTISAVWTQIFLLFLNLNAKIMFESHSEAKNHLIFSVISILQQDTTKVAEIWVVDAG